MKKRFKVLDVFRGVFAMLIVIFHLRTFTNTSLFNNPFVNNSDLFIDFFFVLSGFVIAHHYRQVSSVDKLQLFLKKRWLRMYPLHLAMLLSFVVLSMIAQLFAAHSAIDGLNNANNNKMSFVASLFLLNAVKFPGVNGESWNVSSWAVSAGMICYAFFGGLQLLLYEIKKSNYKKHFASAIVIVAIAVLMLVNGNGMLNYTHDFGYLRGLAGFFTGVLCYHTFTTLQSRVHTLPARFFHFAEIVLPLVIVCCICEGDVVKQYGFLYLILFFALVLLFAFEKGFVSNLLIQSEMLQRTGKYAYAIYMTHTLLLCLFHLIFIDLLHLPSSAYAWLCGLNFLLIYEVSKWAYTHIEMRFAYKATVKKLTENATGNSKMYATEILSAYSTPVNTVL